MKAINPLVGRLLQESLDQLTELRDNPPPLRIGDYVITFATAHDQQAMGKDLRAFLWKRPQ